MFSTFLVYQFLSKKVIKKFSVTGMMCMMGCVLILETQQLFTLPSYIKFGFGKKTSKYGFATPDPDTTTEKFNSTSLNQLQGIQVQGVKGVNFSIPSLSFPAFLTFNPVLVNESGKQIIKLVPAFKLMDSLMNSLTVDLTEQIKNLQAQNQTNVTNGSISLVPPLPQKTLELPIHNRVQRSTNDFDIIPKFSKFPGFKSKLKNQTHSENLESLPKVQHLIFMSRKLHRRRKLL